MLTAGSNLWVNSDGSPAGQHALYPLTGAPLGLTTKQEGERVPGSEGTPGSPARISPVNRSRGRRKRGPGAGTTGVVSRGTRAPTACATGAPREDDPIDSGPMMSGSPRDRNVRTPE